MRRLRFAGPAAAVWAWAVIAAAYAANPAIRPFHGALSDLGAPAATAPWVYNVGLIAAGALITAYSLYLASAACHWLQGYGAACVGIAGVFLALVGIDHSGTRPHDFVSQWFFLLAAIGSAVWGAGELAAGRRIGFAYACIGMGAEVLGALVPWPSTAVKEAFGALAVDAFAVLTFLEFRRVDRHAPVAPYGMFGGRR